MTKPFISHAGWRLLTGLLLLGGCVAAGPSRPVEPAMQISADFRSVALLPVQFVSSQPDSFCHADIDDDLRRSLSRRLQTRGYQPFIVPDRRPESFALDPPTPDVGETPDFLSQAPVGTDTALGIWIEDYMATGLCERYGGGNTLEMTVAVVLYKLPEGKELGRWRASEWGTRNGSSDATVWRVLERLTDRLLAGLP